MNILYELNILYNLSYCLGLATEIFEQPTQPGRATMNNANYDRLMKVLTQLEPYGDYTEEEEDQFDDDELHHLVTTNIGAAALPNDSHQIRRNRRKYRRDNSTESEATVIAKTIPAPEGSNITRPLSDRSAFTEYGTDNFSRSDAETYIESYTDSVATETNSINEPSTASTISNEESEMVFEYDSDNSDHTVCQEVEGLARPRAGWNTSSFPSFGNLVPVANNTKLLPKAPNTARLFWMVATNSRHGRTYGTPDEVYLRRVAQVMNQRLRSRPTSENVKQILSRRAELMPPDSNWARLTVEVWQEKFPQSSIWPDNHFQYLWDVTKNRDLPADQFSSRDFVYLRSQPMKESVQFNRAQSAVLKQSQTATNNWSREEQTRIQNQAHATRAQDQITNVRPDNLIINAMLDFDEYVNEFLANGDKWQKPAGLSSQITKAKNITDQRVFEQNMFMKQDLQVIHNLKNMMNIKLCS